MDPDLNSAEVNSSGGFYVTADCCALGERYVNAVELLASGDHHNRGAFLIRGAAVPLSEVQAAVVKKLQLVGARRKI
ncbi:hypothetical protein ACHMXB_11865 [Arthrobacter sp. UC242_113]